MHPSHLHRHTSRLGGIVLSQCTSIGHLLTFIFDGSLHVEKILKHTLVTGASKLYVVSPRMRRPPASAAPSITWTTACDDVVGTTGDEVVVADGTGAACSLVTAIVVVDAACAAREGTAPVVVAVTGGGTVATCAARAMFAGQRLHFL